MHSWEEWTGMGGTIEDNSTNAFVTINNTPIRIMPRLHSLEIGHCCKLKSLPDYLCNTPLQQKLEIFGCPILQNRDGQFPDSIDTEVTLLFLQNYPIKYINTYMDLCK